MIFGDKSKWEELSIDHCVKSARVRSYSALYFPAFGLNTERYSSSFHIQCECGKIRTRITPNMDTFHAVNRNTFNLIDNRDFD